jgi:integrase
LTLCYYLCYCDGMNAEVTASNTQNAASTRQFHGPTFAKVLDGRKQPIRGLWIRGKRYYAQLKFEHPVTGVKQTKRVPLVDKDGNPAESAAEARELMSRLQIQRADNSLPVLGRQPKFSDYVVSYLEYLASGAKKPGTVEKEKTIVARWTDAIGELRLDQIKRVHVNRFIEKRLKEKVATRTINLDVIGLRVVLKRALSDGLIMRLPTEGLQPLKITTTKRDLFSTSDLEKLCEAALSKKEDGHPVTKNGAGLVEYLRFMAYSGCRRNEALGVQWDDVDFDADLLHVRRQITNRESNGGIEELKNREQRALDLNAKLKALLLGMKERAQGVSKWVFPSPQRGGKDIPSKSFRESMELAKAAAKMPNVGFHDLRHHFISMCVMSGIDYMTIAAWVGHKDGGILIGKVYGHLANEHRKAMAEKINFGPTIVQAISG